MSTPSLATVRWSAVTRFVFHYGAKPSTGNPTWFSTQTRGARWRRLIPRYQVPFGIGDDPRDPKMLFAGMEVPSLAST